ncbi:MAG TPA: hypothetical protein PKY25_01605 [Bacilli bacterium]|nr:hypothetical protein [Bacilli bacterium]
MSKDKNIYGYLADIKSEEGSKRYALRAKEFFEKYFSDIETREEKLKKEILSSYEYINWLTEYTKENIMIYDRKTLAAYHPKDFDENKENLSKISTLCNIVRDYHRKFSIDPLFFDPEQYTYYIKYKGDGYIIGRECGSLANYCEITAIEDSHHVFINFEDIMNDRRRISREDIIALFKYGSEEEQQAFIKTVEEGLKYNGCARVDGIPMDGKHITTIGQVDGRIDGLVKKMKKPKGKDNQ